MKHTQSNNPLVEFGVEMLTGEACTYGMRVLCDMNEKGVKLVRDFLGLDYETVFAKNWNSEVNGAPAIGSIMLTREVIPSLVRFALFREGYQFILAYKDTWGLLAFNSDDASSKGTNSMLQLYIDGTASDIESGKVTVYRNPKSNSPSVGSRNVHQFTGRSN